MNCNHTTCPLCRLEAVATRLEAMLAGLNVPTLAEIYPTPASGATPAPLGLSAVDMLINGTEKGELDALAQHEDGIQQDYQRRVDAWNLREQGTQDYMKRVDAWNLREQGGR